MWPWEHLAFGYVLYSLYSNLHLERPPRSGPFLVLAVGTQFPDLVDKPLSWTFGILPSGLSLAHSIFTWTAISVVALVLTRRTGRSLYGVAFVLGYLSHLIGDAIYPVVLGDSLAGAFLLWPLVPTRDAAAVGFFDRFWELLADYLAFVLTPRGLAVAGLEVLLLVAVLALWVRDGMPGVALLGAKMPERRRFPE